MCMYESNGHRDFDAAVHAYDDTSGELQTQGRWDSDAYLAYLRAAEGRVVAISLRACSLEVKDHAQHFVDIDMEPEFD